MKLRSLLVPLALSFLCALPAGAQLLPKDGWTLHEVDSVELAAFDGAATNAFDGDPATFWHTQLAGGSVAPPHWIAIDLGAHHDLSGLRYLPRADEAGRIDLFELSVSDDGASWGEPVATGFFRNDTGQQEVTFPETSGRYVRLRALREVNGDPWTAVAEIDLLGSAFSGNFAPDASIDAPAASLGIAVGDSVVFAGSASDPEDPPGALSYLWSFGDPAIPDRSVEDPGAVAFDTPGTFVVTLTVTDAAGRADSTPATRIVRVLEPGTDPSLPQAAFSVVAADSEELVLVDGAAANAIDADPATLWHTETGSSPPPPPHDLAIDLGATYTVDGFRVLPRQDAETGRIEAFQLYVSGDGASWGAPVATGTFANEAAEQAVLCPPTPGRFVRLVALSEVGGAPETALAELSVEGFAASAGTEGAGSEPGAGEGGGGSGTEGGGSGSGSGSDPAGSGAAGGAPAGGTASVEMRVTASNDDAEEEPDGTVRLTSSDLELTTDRDYQQTVGMRFPGIDVPQAATILSAWVQFRTDETSSNPVSLTIQAQAADDALSFTGADHDISSRPRTAASVGWAPPAWSIKDEVGPDQQTPDLAAVIQEVVSRPGWAPGNALAVIVTGTGRRVAESADGSASGAPLLHVEYATGPPVNQPPAVDAGSDQTLVLPYGSAALDGTVDDDGVSGLLLTTWTHVGGTGAGLVVFDDPSAVDTTAHVTSDPGSYVLRLTADDGEFRVLDELTLNVLPEGSGPFTLLEADFDADLDGFAYADDTFRGTAEPGYASGVHDSAGGQSGGGLRVDIGGIDGANIEGMSGGFTRTFELAEPAEVTLSFAYLLDVAASYENNEYGEALVSVDGVLHGVPPDDYLARIHGGGATGWQSYEVALGILSPGTHVLTLGGHNNKKTSASEQTRIRFDDVLVQGSTAGLVNTAPQVDAGSDQTIVLPSGATLDGSVDDDGLPHPPGATSVLWTAESGPGSVSFADPNAVDTTATFSAEGAYLLRLTADDGELQGFDEVAIQVDPEGSGPQLILDAHFDAGPDGFDYKDDTFRGTSAPAYASGSFSAAAGSSGGGLRVDLGGIDGVDVVGMSGGFSRTFTLPEPMQLTVSLDFDLEQTPDYESSEWSEALLALDGTLHGIPPDDHLARVVGGAAGPGWQTVTLDLGVVGPGPHTLTVGGYNNKKTSSNESTLVRFDEILLLGSSATLENSAPTVDAGPALSVVLPDDAVLDATVTDDGLPWPPGQVTITWSAVSGPGPVVFGDPSAVDTTASFTVSGNYVLRLVADDSELSAFDEVAVEVLEASSDPAVVEQRVAAGDDDAEESASGEMYLVSSDLEMTFDLDSHQTVGMRFELWVPRGAAITDAWIQFTADEPTSNPTSLLIEAQDSDHAAVFGAGASNISSRPRTAASVAWSPPAWLASDDAGSAQRTPDLSALIQEVVDRSGWLAGNHVGIIVTGSGERVAHAHNGSPGEAPLLHVEYLGSIPNRPPVVDAGPSQSLHLPEDTVLLDGTVSDDGKPGPSLSTFWSHVGGTGTGSVSFGDPTAVDTTATISADPGTYTLRLSADDGARVSSDDTTVFVFTERGGQVISIQQVNQYETGIPGGSPLTIPAIDPASVVFHDASGELFIADSEINEVSQAWNQVGANLFQAPPDGSSLTDSWDLTNSPSPFSDNKEPTGITWCASDDHFYGSNDDTRSIYRYAFDGSDFTVIDEVSTVPFADDPEGITCDPVSGLIYVVSGVGTKILVYSYAGGFVLEDHFDLSDTAGTSKGIPSDPEGIAFDPVSGHLFVVSDPDERIFEYTRDGVFVDSFGLSGLSPDPVAPQGLAIGPSSATPGEMSFYIADGGVDNDEDSSERDGRIYEAEIERSP